MENEVVGFEGETAQDGAHLSAMVSLGMCIAIREGAVTTGYACAKLFRPKLVQTLRLLQIDPILCDALEAALELEDIEEIVPQGLEPLLNRLVASLISYLKSIPDSDIVNRRCWMTPVT